MSQNVVSNEKGTALAKQIWDPLKFQRNEFRILELLEVRDEGSEQVIHATVHNEPFSGHRPYAALSYAWGTLTGSKEIHLNNVAHLITENLSQALLVLFAQGITNLWVDALCIDQDNPDEKAAQVQRMATIFQEAESVVIWLGTSSLTSDKLLDFLKDVHLASLYQRFWGQPFLELDEPSGNLILNESFLEFLDRDYWHRTWCVQEIATAQSITLFCGANRVDGTILETLFSRTMWKVVRPEAYSTWCYTSFRAFEGMINLWGIRHFFRSRRPMDLLSLLYEVRRGKTSLELDRVYAVLGLAFDQRSFVAEPDYNLSAHQLCLQMTKRFIKLTGSLDVTLLGGPRTYHSERTSWCCPFLEFDEIDNIRNDVLPFIDYVNGKMHKLRCGEPRNFWNTTDHSIANDKNVLWEGEVLQLVGLKLGRSFDLDPRTWNLDLEPQGLQIFNSICRLLMIHSHLCEDVGYLRKLVIQVFESSSLKWISWASPTRMSRADEFRPGQQSSSEDPNVRGKFPQKGIPHLSSRNRRIRIQTGFVEELKALIERSKEEAAERPTPVPTAEDIQLAMDTVMEFLEEPRIFFTIDLKSIGLRPDYLFGDCPDGELEIWLLSGCSFPVILERQDSDWRGNQSSYRIVSETLVDSAMIHGEYCRVMDGEAWKTARKEDFQWINII